MSILNELARKFLAEKAHPALKPYSAEIEELLCRFAVESVLPYVSRRISDQNHHPQKISRMYWQTRLETAREIEALAERLAHE